MLQPKLTKVEPVKPLKLCLYYETGEVKLFDAALMPPARGTASCRMSVTLLPCICCRAVLASSGKRGRISHPHELYENSVPVKKTA